MALEYSGALGVESGVGALGPQGAVPDIRAGKEVQPGDEKKYVAKRVAAAVTTLGFSELYNVFDNRENSSSEVHKEYLAKKAELAELAEQAVLKEGDDLLHDQAKMQKLAEEVGEAAAKDMAKTNSTARKGIRDLLVRAVADGLTLGTAELINVGEKVKKRHDGKEVS